MCYSAATGSTDAKRPRLPWSENLTRPLTLANKVSSDPMPTLVPGLIRVPRCRTMIDPPVTSSPANAFTPRRWALESRPFVELPPPFLCAIAESSSVEACRRLKSGGIGDAVRLDGLDAYLGKILAVSLQLLVLLFALVMEHQDLVPAAVADDLSGHLGGARLNHIAGFARNGENVAELDGLFAGCRCN